MHPQIARHVGHFLVEPGPPREVVLARNIFFGPRAKKFAFTWKKNQAGWPKVTALVPIFGSAGLKVNVVPEIGLRTCDIDNGTRRSKTDLQVIARQYRAPEDAFIPFLSAFIYAFNDVLCLRNLVNRK